MLLPGCSDAVLVVSLVVSVVSLVVSFVVAIVVVPGGKTLVIIVKSHEFCVTTRPCPIMLKMLPIRLFSNAHVFTY